MKLPQAYSILATLDLVHWSSEGELLTEYPLKKLWNDMKLRTISDISDRMSFGWDDIRSQSKLIYIRQNDIFV